MAKKIDAAAEALATAIVSLVAAVVTEAGKGADIAEAMPTRSKKTDDDDEEDDVDPAAKAKALKQLAKLDLDEADRPTMKPFAEALGLDTQGKKTAEVRAMLADALKGKKAKPAADEDDDEKPKRGPGRPKKKPADDEDDDEDEKPKGKKKKPADDDEDDIEFPDTKTMKKEVRIFAKAYKKQLTKTNPDFFDSDADEDDDNPGLHQILGDEDLLKETWKDNIAPQHNDDDGGKTWKKTVKLAEAADDDDD